jgi:hypothetical protein
MVLLSDFILFIWRGWNFHIFFSNAGIRRELIRLIFQPNATLSSVVCANQLEVHVSKCYLVKCCVCKSNGGACESCKRDWLQVKGPCYLLRSFGMVDAVPSLFLSIRNTLLFEMKYLNIVSCYILIMIDRWNCQFCCKSCIRRVRRAF